jgi:hypothetical protein
VGLGAHDLEVQQKKKKYTQWERNPSQQPYGIVWLKYFASKILKNKMSI